MIKKKILIIDDDDAFRQALKNTLEDYNIYAYCTQPKKEQIISAVSLQPTDIIIDQYLNFGWSAERWLNYLKDDINWNKYRIWFISGARNIENQRLLDLKKKYSGIQLTWFQKPISIESLIAALQLEGKSPKYRLPKGLESIPLPIRVINKGGAVIYHRNWSISCFEPDTSAFFDCFNKETSPTPIEFWGQNPNNNTTGPFRIISFFCEGDNKHLIQIVESIPFRQQDNLKVVIEQLAAFMKMSGFVRTRFYRIIKVPRCNGILELIYCNHDLNTKIDRFIYPKTIRNIVKNIISEIDGKKDKIPKKLLYKIWKNNPDEENKDEDLAFLKESVGLTKNIEDRLIIPVLTKNLLTNEYRAIALLFFDRSGNHSGLMDGNKAEIKNRHIRPKTQTLRHSIAEIVRIMTTSNKDEELHEFREVAEIDKKLFQVLDREKIQNNLLSTLVDIFRPTIGLFIDQVRGTNKLFVKASYGLNPENLKNFYYDLDEEEFIFKIWTANKEHYLPNYDKVKNKLRLIDKFEGHLDSETIEDIGCKVRAFASFPLAIGKEKLGLMLFFNSERFSFNEPRIRNAKKIIQRARWVLKASELFEYRRVWEYSFIHEIRGSLGILQESINRIHDIGKSDEDTKVASRFVSRLFDTADDFMDLHKNISPELYENFSGLKDEIERLINYYELEISINQQEISLEQNKAIRLRDIILLGQKNYFRRVLRVIFDNAIKYGNSHSIIMIQFNIEDEFFYLNIINEGRMSLEEDELKYLPFRKAKNSKKDGAHVGLAVAKKIVQAHHGDIDVYNEKSATGEYVVSKLKWPIFRENGEK